MKKTNFTLLLLLAVVQLSVAQIKNEDFRLPPEKEAERTELIKKNKAKINFIKNIEEMEKDALFKKNYLNVGYQQGFLATLGNSYSLTIRGRSVPLIEDRYLVFAGEANIGYQEKIGGFVSVLAGFDIIRTGGAGFFGATPKNKRGNLPKLAVFNFEWIVGYRHLFVMNSNHAGFSAIVSNFVMSVTPRLSNGKTSHVQLNFGFEVGPYINKPTYLRDNMHGYLKRDDWNYFDSRSNWEWHQFHGTFFASATVPLAMGTGYHKNVKTRDPCIIF